MSEIDLTSPEVQKAIADAVAAEVQGLKAKNNELIEANKKLRKGQEIDPEDYSRLEQERDDLKGKLGEANKALGKASKDLEVANKKATDTEAAFNRTTADSALSEALSKAGVTNAVHLKAAKALLGSSLQVVDDNGNKVVKAGDKALGDFVTEWAGSDEGKHFVAAHNANGDGARNNPAGKSNPTSISRAAFDALDANGRMAHTKSGGIVTD